MTRLKNFVAVPLITFVIAVAPVTANCASSDTSRETPEARACASDPECQRSSWKDEFERLCAQTEIATTFSAERLKKLISDSDELMEQLEALEDSRAKIYRFRLKGCRNFFVYALELHSSSGKTGQD